MLAKAISKLLISYYRTPDHPGKERVWERLTRLLPTNRVILPYASAGWIAVDLKDPRQKELLANPSWESEIWQTLMRHVEEDEVFWDIGAYTGLHSIRAIWDPGVREVHCFEGASGAFELLKANLDLNDGRLYSHPFTPGMSVDDSAILTIDDVVRKKLAPTPSLIRIFTPGRELEVLEGARKLLTEAPPKALLFEAPSDAAGVLRERKIRDFLELVGMTWKRVDRASGEVEARENYVATPIHPVLRKVFA